MNAKKKARVRVAALALTLTLAFVLEAGLEPARANCPQDFKSGVSTIPPLEHPVPWIQKRSTNAP